MRKNEIKENLNELLSQINEEVYKYSIKREIILVAVSKTFPAEDIIIANEFGQTHFGENKIQESERKMERVNSILSEANKPVNYLRWHFIGHLQSNKAKTAVKLFDTIHSLDKISTIKKVSKHAVDLNKKIDIMVQVNTSGEDSKYGCNPAVAVDICEKCLKLSNINLCGLMTIGPLTKNEKAIGESFRKLRKLRDGISDILNHPIPFLSMGMSSDWRIALREGATHLRIGSTIFGKRDYK